MRYLTQELLDRVPLDEGGEGEEGDLLASRSTGRRLPIFPRHDANPEHDAMPRKREPLEDEILR